MQRELPPSERRRTAVCSLYPLTTSILCSNTSQRCDGTWKRRQKHACTGRRGATRPPKTRRDLTAMPPLDNTGLLGIRQPIHRGMRRTLLRPSSAARSASASGNAAGHPTTEFDFRRPRRGWRGTVSLPSACPRPVEACRRLGGGGAVFHITPDRTRPMT